MSTTNIRQIKRDITKKYRPEKSGLYFFRLSSLRFALDVAISAVYRFIAARLEGYLSLFATLCANCGEHLARATAHAAAIAITLRPSVLPANRAPLGLISIALGCEELLLFHGEGERFSAIGTLERLLLKRHSG